MCYSCTLRSGHWFYITFPSPGLLLWNPLSMLHRKIETKRFSKNHVLFLAVQWWWRLLLFKEENRVFQCCNWGLPRILREYTGQDDLRNSTLMQVPLSSVRFRPQDRSTHCRGRDYLCSPPRYLGTSARSTGWYIVFYILRKQKSAHDWSWPPSSTSSVTVVSSSLTAIQR